jgi:hypothetical protein
MIKKQQLTSHEWNLLRTLEEELYTITNKEKTQPTKTWLKKRIKELKERAGEIQSS